MQLKDAMHYLPSYLIRSLIVAVLLVASGPVDAADADGAKLGTKIANVSFKDADGKTTALYDLTDKKAVVVVFLNFECPNSTGYAPILTEMAKRFSDKGVAFIGICAGEEDAAAVAAHAKEFKLGFPVFKDEKSAAVSALKAEITPEAFALDHNLVLRYRGRIDDAFSARLKKNAKINNHDLTNALDQLLAGQPVTTPLTTAVGCPIWTGKEVKKDGKVTYYRDVLPILQNSCQSCHRPGEVAPFSLMTFKHAVNWASDIKDYTQGRQMPPWKIAEGIPFRNERKLSDAEIATLAAWADGGMAEGDPKDAPKKKEFTDAWMLGKPDLILEANEDFVVGPGGHDLFRCYVLPTHLDEEKFIVGFEVKPGNPRVVHHTLNFIDTRGRARQLESTAQAKEKEQKPEFDRGPGYSQSMGIGFLPSGAIGGWAPGQMANQLPEGYGWPLPKGADVVIQVHYHRDGRLEKDRPRIGLYFAKKPEGIKPFKTGIIPGFFLSIPPNDANFKVTGSAKAKEDCTIYNIMPHMHLIGRSIKITMTPPGGETTTLLAIRDWDYNWQETYFLKEPLRVKQDTHFQLEAIYDNSSKNPNNPNDPPKTVTIGEQTTNEMCFVFFGTTSDSRGLIPPILPDGLGGGFRKLGAPKTPEK
jgi:peroxiredoxin